jgi:asparagine synthase (glutamine-hydrolysing)
MSDFFGIVSRKEVPVKEEWLGQMQKVLATWEPDYTNMLHRSDVGLGQNSLRITPESFFEFLPETLHGLSLVANARIDNREELLKQLDVPRAEVITDATIILYAYLKWGTRCPEKLIGEFAFAIWDENDKSLFCAKDALGIRPLYYHIGSDFVVISTEVRGVFASGLMRKKLNKLMLAVHLSSFKGEQEQTVYENVLSLKAAHWLLSKGDNVRTERYWSGSIKPELKLRNSREYEEAFSEKLQVAVKRRLRVAGTVGSLMSGGLDSTAITGIALKQNSLDKPLQIQSWANDPGLEQDLPDDRPYVEAFLKFHGPGNYHHSYIHGLNGYFSYLPQFQRLCDQPYLDMELPARFNSYEQFRENNVRVILSGTGGDQFATYNAYEYPFHLLSQVRFLKLFKTLSVIKKKDSLTWRNTLARHLVYPYRAVRAGVEPWGKGYPLSGRNFLEARKGKLFLHPELLRETSFEEYIKEHESTQNLPSPFSSPLKNALLMNLNHSGMEISFNQRYHLTQAYKMQYTYPLLDREVVSLLLSMPADQFHQHGLGRSIIRRSMGDFVPEKILRKQAKIGSAPFIRDIREKDLPLVFHALEKWKNNPAIAQTVDLPLFEKHLINLRSGKELTDRYYVRTVFLCNFLYNSFN